MNLLECLQLAESRTVPCALARANGGGGVVVRAVPLRRPHAHAHAGSSSSAVIPSALVQARAKLPADYYSLLWDVRPTLSDTRATSAPSPSTVRGLTCELHAGDRARAPLAVYDWTRMPVGGVTFQLAHSATVTVRIFVRAMPSFTIHALRIRVARRSLHHRVSNVAIWDLPRVSHVLQKQHRWCENARTARLALFRWRDLRRDLADIQRAWCALFGARAAQLAPERVECAGAAVLSTSATPCLCELSNVCHGRRRPRARREGGMEWYLRVGADAPLRPTFMHPRYYVWCLPERQLKVAVERVLSARVPSGRGSRFQLSVGAYDRDVARRAPALRPLLWLGYNMIRNLPYATLWAVEPARLEVADAEDVVTLLRLVEQQFDGGNDDGALGSTHALVRTA